MSLLELYDAQERENAVVLGMRREALPGLVRQIDLVGTSSTVLWSRLDSSIIDTAIARETAYFAGLGHDLEWKAFAYDQPPDLVQRLEAHGFEAEEREAIMVLELERAETLGPAPAARRIQEEAELRAALTTLREGRADRAERLVWELREAPDQLSVYVAEIDGRPASCGWVRFPPKTSFASLWGGATDPRYRGRGLYSQLVSARVEEARRRGFRYVTVDARPMSRPILERRGFQVLTWATACTRHPPAGQ